MSAEQRADQDRFLFEVSKQRFKVVDFSAREALSEPYEVMLTLASKDEIPIDDMIQKEALLTIYGSESERYFHGMVNSFRMAGSSGRFMLYKAIVVPTLWTLSLEQDCRIFQEMTVKDIVTEILEDAGIKSDRYKFQLKETYPERNYCVPISRDRPRLHHPPVGRGGHLLLLRAPGESTLHRLRGQHGQLQPH